MSTEELNENTEVLPEDMDEQPPTTLPEGDSEEPVTPETPPDPEPPVVDEQPPYTPVEYIQVDENGIPQDTFALDPNYDTIPPNTFPGYGPHAGFEFPIWDFDLGKWVEGAPSAVKLSNAKVGKIADLNRLCQETILGRFTCTVNGVEYSFSCDDEAQKNFDKYDRAFEQGRITEINWTAKDASGEYVRLTLTQQTFEPVYMAHLDHIKSNVERFRDILQPKIEAATTIEEVNAITW